MDFLNETVLNNQDLTECKKIYYYLVDIYNLIGKTLATVILLIYSIYNMNNNEIWKFMILLSVFILMELLFRPLVEHSKIDKMNYKVAFYKEKFIINDDIQTETIYYNAIEKVIETKMNFIIVVNKRILAVKKECFTIGNEKDFKKFIEDKVKKE